MRKIACVKWGSAYSSEYVNILYDAIKRNCSIDFEFICFTDNPESIDDEITIHHLPDGVEGWWNKLYLFEALKEGALFFDLDTLIVGNIDDLIEYSGKFIILRDFYRPDGYGSGVMAWNGDYSYIWNKWIESGKPILDGGDQEWIEQMIDAELIQERFAGKFISYKEHCFNGIPSESSVVCFHGQPKPHNAGGWVNSIWKKGGGDINKTRWMQIEMA